MAWRLVKSLEVLRSEANLWRPDRDKASDGSVADQNHPTSSDHSPKDYDDDGTGEVLALDIDADNGEVARYVRDTILETRDPRLAYMIYNRQIWRSYQRSNNHPPAWTPQTYRGSNPHTTHVHISVHRSPILYDDDSPWGLVMTEQDREFIEDIVGGLRRQIVDLRAEVAQAASDATQRFTNVDKQHQRIERRLKAIEEGHE